MATAQGLGGTVIRVGDPIIKKSDFDKGNDAGYKYVSDIVDGKVYVQGSDKPLRNVGSYISMR